MKRYKIAGHKSLFYVVGYCGIGNDLRPKFIPVSDGFKTRTEAQSAMLKQYKADQSARRELEAV